MSDTYVIISFLAPMIVLIVDAIRHVLERWSERISRQATSTEKIENLCERTIDTMIDLNKNILDLKLVKKIDEI